MDQGFVQSINHFNSPIRIVGVDALIRPVFLAFNNAALLDAGLRHEDIVGRTSAEVYVSYGSGSHQVHQLL